MRLSTYKDNMTDKLFVFGEYNEDGKALFSGYGFFQVGNKKASFKVLDISTWRIENRYLIENTLRTKFTDYQGDIDLINMLREIYENDSDKEEEKSKILKLNEDICILSINKDGAVDDIITLHRIK